MKLTHPSLDATVEVDSSEANKWVRAGWIAPKPKPSPKPEPFKGPESK